jgi:hypothetical protein
MPRDTALARVVVVATLAVAATAIGLSLTSPDDSSSGVRHQNVAVAPAPAEVSEKVTTSGPPPETAPPATMPPGSTTSPSVTPAPPATTSPTTAPVTAPVAATTVAPATTPTTARPVVAIAGGGVAIGDSVLEDVALYAPSTLKGKGIAINAAVSRQWAAGESIVASMRASGSLPGVVVVALGSNGPIHAADFDKMMTGLAGVRRVVFMTVTGPLVANNDIIRAGVARYPQAALADWAVLAAANPTWFAKDHVHVGAAGATALGQLLASVA